MLIRHLVHTWRLAPVVLLVCCMVKKADDPSLTKEGKLRGNLAFQVVNKTPWRVDSVLMWEDGTPAVAGSRFDVAIEPGATGPAFQLKPGTIRMDIEGSRPEGNRGEREKYHSLLKEHKVVVDKPTAVVLYEGPKPTDPPPAGLTQHFVPSTDDMNKFIAGAAAKQQEKKANAGLAECTKDVPPKDEKPSLTGPKKKLDGRWNCVLAGGWNGTDHVTLTQLADGHITATITGMDANSTWDGVIVGDELHYHYTGLAGDGGRLKIDPGGRAMIGDGYSLTQGGDCKHYTMTCNR